MRTRTVAGAGVSLSVLEAGDPARPTVVFIHGYPDSKEMWRAVMGRLEDRFHLLAYDVRGAGGSSAPPRTADYDLERLGDDLLAVIADAGPVHLVGHDWGGIQGWEFATQPRFEGRLASFTSIAGPSLDQVAAGRGNPLRAWRSWYILVLVTPGGPTLAWRVVRRARRSAAERRTALNGANLYRRNIPRRMLHPRRHPVAHVPVQLIIPTRDRYIPVGYYARAEQHAPRLKRRMIDSSHWAPAEQPETVARWIEEFVENS